MKNKRIILSNSFVSLLNQIIVIFFSFITRSIFIRYIGIELLGINSTFTSVLSTLSVAELGFQTAVVYSLYEPLQYKNVNKINDILNSLKYIYRFIGIFFVMTSIALCPFLSFILNGINVTSQIYIYFILQALTSACSYFFAYKRTILYADQKIYIFKLVDTICVAIINILQIVTLVLLRNYLLFLILKIFQVYGANIWVNYICSKEYPFLCNGKANKIVLKELYNNVKNIFVGKIASYIYLSTDNLVISIIIGTAWVGVYANYTTISTSIRYIADSMLNPLASLLGNILVKELNCKKREKIYLLFSDIRYAIALVLVVPTIILMNPFIILWIGEKYLLSKMIVLLLGVDLYIHIVHSVSVDFINGLGLFAYDKYIGIIAAASNIIFSILLTYNYGIEGVLLGTVISQSFFWIGRSAIVYFVGIKTNVITYFKYWMRNCIQLCFFIITLVCCEKVVNYVALPNVYFIQFIEKGLISVGIVFISIIIYVLLIPLYRKKITNILKNKIKSFITVT